MLGMALKKLYRNTLILLIQDFTGNKDRDTVVYHELNPAFRARYIRLRPETWENFISMRMELYGCPDGRKSLFFLKRNRCHETTFIVMVYLAIKESFGLFNIGKASKRISNLGHS